MRTVEEEHLPCARFALLVSVFRLGVNWIMVPNWFLPQGVLRQLRFCWIGMNFWRHGVACISVDALHWLNRAGPQ